MPGPQPNPGCPATSRPCQWPEVSTPESTQPGPKCTLSTTALGLWGVLSTPASRSTAVWFSLDAHGGLRLLCGQS